VYKATDIVPYSRLGVKATTLKAKAKDLASKAKDLASKAKAKDLASKAKDKAKDGVKANVNIWFAVQSKLQNTAVYCRAGNDYR